jgi:cytochrome P450
LQNAYWKIKESWECDPIAKEFLENLGDAGYGIGNFDPVGELIQNILSASETTAASLMWATEILGRNPSYQELLTSNNFSYLDFFIDEVLRLYPPLPLVTRMALNDCSFDGVEFKKSEQFVISIVGINCHRDYWSDPLMFQFPRKEFVDGPYKKIAYKPFISGPRVCAGMKLARRELGGALQVLLRHYPISKIDAPFTFKSGLTCRPGTFLDAYIFPKS